VASCRATARECWRSDHRSGLGRAEPLFRLRRVHIDTQSERVVFIHEDAVRTGELGFKPLDRVNVVGGEPGEPSSAQVTGILNFCRNGLVAPDEVGLSEVAFADLGLPEDALVRTEFAPPPASLERVRSKLHGRDLSYRDFEAILGDVVRHRYSKVELAMFILACALKTISDQELVAFTRAMINVGQRLRFGPGPIADKHCIGGVPGNRTSMIVVPILTSLGMTVPKTSSRAITSPSGTADTMATLAEVALTPEHLRSVVEEVGGCIAWGGALDLAPADDILITVERPMEIDTEPQMVASILAKKVTAGATHALIDIPVGNTAKVRSESAALVLSELFEMVSEQVGLTIETMITRVNGPVGFGIGPRLEALDVLSVLRGAADAPWDLRERSIQIAARILEMTGHVPKGRGTADAVRALDSGEAAQTFDRIRRAQGERSLPPAASQRCEIRAEVSGRVREIDCWRIARVAKRAGAPAHAAAGVRLLRRVDDEVRAGDPLYEIHAQSRSQLASAEQYARSHRAIYQIGSPD
jgi:thymidine phosphorylase